MEKLDFIALTEINIKAEEAVSYKLSFLTNTSNVGRDMEVG